jgi:hypothetical protein
MKRYVEVTRELTRSSFLHHKFQSGVPQENIAPKLLVRRCCIGIMTSCSLGYITYVSNVFTVSIFTVEYTHSKVLAIYEF